MTVYTVNAVVRDARGREIAYRQPLVTRDCATVREAVELGRAAARQLADDPRAETVVLNVRGGKDRVSATEYATDLRGRHSSCSAETQLLDMGEGISEQEMQHNLERLRKQAVEAMPELKAKAIEARNTAPDSDPVRDFFGGKSYATPKTDEEKFHEKWAEMGSPLSGTLNKGGKIDWPNKLHEVSDAIHDFRRTSGREVGRVVMNPAAYDELLIQNNAKRYLGADVQISGVPVVRSDDPHAPPVAMEPRPRTPWPPSQKKMIHDEISIDTSEIEWSILSPAINDFCRKAFKLG